jgi:hypothetical protein
MMQLDYANEKLEQKSGVIAVLFLFIVAFVFAAISMSMQTGQIVERRIQTDFATDSAAMAVASKSAQGLNFMAANNLATAAASHMVGAIHLAADWTAMLLTIIKAESLIRGGIRDMTPNKMVDLVDTPYKILAPVTKLYFRSATGMTRLSLAIKTVYPYLGMVDAIAVGGANVPSSVVIPFKAPRDNTTNQSGQSGPFIEQIKTSLTSLFGMLNMNYQGLRRINSDEAFCLAYKAGELAITDNKRHEIAEWISGSAFDLKIAGIDLKAMGDVFSGASKFLDALGVIANLISLRVGFSGCGFGEAGDPHGGEDNSFDKALIAKLFISILQGPLSGRPAEIKLGENSVNLPIIHGEDYVALANKLDTLYHDECTHSKAGKWSAGESERTFHTPFESKIGFCVHEKQPTQLKRYFRDTTSYQAGRSTSGPIGENEEDLVDYDVACFGTILFKWSGYSGLIGKPKPGNRAGTAPDGNDNDIDFVPSPETHPKVDKLDREKNLCPPMVANPEPKNMSKLLIPRNVPGGDNYVNLSRSAPLLQPILLDLSTDDAGKIKNWRGKEPAARTFQKISDAIGCASGNHTLCTGVENGKGYMSSTENEDGTGDEHKFFPNLNSYNWLCPLSKKASNAKNMIAANLKFSNYSPLRWRSTKIDFPRPEKEEDTRYESRYPSIMAWHDQRVQEFVDGIDCSSYAKYAKGTPKGPQKTYESEATESHDFCSKNGHMCWQHGMQKMLKEKLKDGELSFVLPDASTNNNASESPLEQSLHYGVFMMNPMRIDDGHTFVGRNDGSNLAHCPAKMDVEVELEDHSKVNICDVQPIVGFVARQFKDAQGNAGTADTKIVLDADANLASGGGMTAFTEVKSTGFLAIAQASASYEQELVGDPYRANEQTLRANRNFNTKSLNGKVHQLFWPSWKPNLEPSRVFSHLVGEPISNIVED